MRISRYFVQVLSVWFAVVCLGSSFCYGADKGKLYVLGMGPSEADLTAPRAVAILEKADIILCSLHMQERFGKHIDPDNVAFNPWEL